MRKEKKMKTHGAGNHGVLETPCVVVCETCMKDKCIENIFSQREEQPGEEKYAVL